MIRVAYASHYDIRAAVDRCHTLLEDFQPALLLVFCGGKHDPVAAFAALRSVFGTMPIVGGSAAGAISPDGLGYSGLELG